MINSLPTLPKRLRERMSGDLRKRLHWSVPTTSGASVALRISLCAFVLAVSPSAEAYIGPGLGLSALGTLIALVAALALSVIGFFWYPIRILMRKFSAWKSKRLKPR
jgi:hypothetical protein